VKLSKEKRCCQAQHWGANSPKKGPEKGKDIPIGGTKARRPNPFTLDKGNHQALLEFKTEPLVSRRKMKKCERQTWPDE